MEFHLGKTDLSWYLNVAHCPICSVVNFVLFVSSLFMDGFRLMSAVHLARRVCVDSLSFQEKLLSVSTMPPKDRGLSVKPPYNYCIMNSSQFIKSENHQRDLSGLCMPYGSV